MTPLPEEKFATLMVEKMEQMGETICHALLLLEEHQPHITEFLLKVIEKSADQLSTCRNQTYVLLYGLSTYATRLSNNL